MTIHSYSAVGRQVHSSIRRHRARSGPPLVIQPFAVPSLMKGNATGNVCRTVFCESERILAAHRTRRDTLAGISNLHANIPHCRTSPVVSLHKLLRLGLQLISLTRTLSIHRESAITATNAAMFLQPLVNVLSRACRQAPIVTFPLDSESSSMMKCRHYYPLPVSPPVNSWISTAHARQTCPRKLKHRVEFGYLRLVGNLIERWFHVKFGMAKPTAITNHNPVGVLDHRCETRVHHDAEVTKYEMKPKTNNRKVN